MGISAPMIEISGFHGQLTGDEVGRAGELHQGSLFHGTGRFARGYEGRDKRKPNGQIIDVLGEILQRGIQYQVDVVSRVFLPIEKTVSLTRQRMYARCYAEIFGEDDERKTHLEYAFGTLADWWPYFVHETVDKMLSPVNAALIPVVVKNLLSKFTRDEILHIFDRYHLLKQWNVNRARIKGNYPMIFGIRESAVEPIWIPHGLDYFEVRSDRTVPPDALKFVEVPLKFINETRDLIAKVGAISLDVVPLEAGEAACAMRGVTNCIIPNPELGVEARAR